MPPRVGKAVLGGWIRIIIATGHTIGGATMAFEHPTPTGAVWLIRAGKRWKLHYAERQRTGWRSPDAAALAAARHRTGLAEWDQNCEPVSDDLLDWRPLGDSL